MSNTFTYKGIRYWDFARLDKPNSKLRVTSLSDDRIAFHREQWIQHGVHNDDLKALGYGEVPVPDGWVDAFRGPVGNQYKVYYSALTKQVTPNLPKYSVINPSVRQGKFQITTAQAVANYDFAARNMQSFVYAGAKFAERMLPSKSETKIRLITTVTIKDEQSDSFAPIYKQYTVSTPFMARNAKILGQALWELIYDLYGFTLISIDDLRIEVLPPVNGSSGVKLPTWLIGNKGIFQIINTDNLCGQRSIAVLIATPDQRKRMKAKETIMKKAALKVCEKIGWSGSMSLNEFDRAAEVYKRTIVIMHARDKVLHVSGESYGNEIYIYHDITCEHYHAILNMSTFSTTNKRVKWCALCKEAVPYDSFDYHKCKGFKCKCCQTGFTTKEEVHVIDKRSCSNCPECNQFCLTSECLSAHIQNKHRYRGTKRAGLVKKPTIWKCSDCKTVVPYERHVANRHVCKEEKCLNCMRYFLKGENHRCSLPIREPTSADTGEKQTYYAFDFETANDSNFHEVNYSCARNIDPKYSGDYIEHSNIADFCSWFIKLKSTTLIAHNMKGFDGWLILHHLVKTYGKKPDSVIKAGEKIMYMKFGSVCFLDSLNHCAMPLSKFPKTFGMDESKFKKGYFPYKFNLFKNMNYIGPIPDREMFNPELMGVSKQHIDKVKCSQKDKCDHCNFNSWYDKQEGDYDMAKELREYCRSDVDILAEGMHAYRTQGIEKNRVDPLRTITSASYSMKVYNTNFCPSVEELDKENGLEPDPRFSKALEGEGDEKSLGGCCILSREEYNQIKPAFSGGRTEVFQLEKSYTDEEIKEGKSIEYRDIVSLYSTVQYYDALPYGIPTIKNFDANEQVKAMESALTCFGFVECDMICPQDLHIPVIGAKKDGKFIFDLRPIKKTLVCTPELNVALKHGYVIKHVYKTISFRSSKSMFKKYVANFLKTKTEANGFNGSPEEEAEFRKSYKELYGDELGELKSNPGAKAMSKICLNSLWGKFGQSPNHKTNVFVSSLGEWFKIIARCNNNEITINSIKDLGDSLLVTFTELDESKTSLAKTNVALCAMITSNARCRLYEVLGKLGKRALYADTDSVIFSQEPGEWEPEKSKLMGGWEDELDGEKIQALAAVAPKTYAFKTTAKKNDVKAKGMTLNQANYSKINMKAFQDMAKGKIKSLRGCQLNFKKSKDGISTTIGAKDLSMDRDKFKRIINADNTTRPYK